jgi:hypothetical protein
MTYEELLAEARSQGVSVQSLAEGLGEMSAVIRHRAEQAAKASGAPQPQPVHVRPPFTGAPAVVQSPPVVHALPTHQPKRTPDVPPVAVPAPIAAPAETGTRMATVAELGGPDPTGPLRVGSRETFEAGRRTERNGIVAWLRAEGVVASAYADAIVAGEHEGAK